MRTVVKLNCFASGGLLSVRNLLFLHGYFVRPHVSVTADLNSGAECRCPPAHRWLNTGLGFASGNWKDVLMFILYYWKEPCFRAPFFLNKRVSFARFIIAMSAPESNIMVMLFATRVLSLFS
jgi:hypothetical protein